LNCVFFPYSLRSLVFQELSLVAHFAVTGWNRALWAALALLVALAWFVVLVWLAPVLFAVQAIALALAGKMVVEAEFPAKARLVAPNA